MRLSLTIPPNLTEKVENWRFVLDFARICDEAGVDRIVAPDHVVFGERLEAYAEPWHRWDRERVATHGLRRQLLRADDPPVCSLGR